MKESYGSEGEFIGTTSNNGGSESGMQPNGNSKAMWEVIFKVSQLVAPLILMAMVYLMIQQNGLDRRLAIVEVTIRNQPVDVALIQKLAVIEDRQNGVMRKLDEVDTELGHHRERSTYDPAGANRRIRE